MSLVFGLVTDASQVTPSLGRLEMTKLKANGKTVQVNGDGASLLFRNLREEPDREQYVCDTDLCVAHTGYIQQNDSS